MGSKHAKQNHQTGCGYGYLPLSTFLNPFGTVCNYLPFNYYNFNYKLPCGYSKMPHLACLPPLATKPPVKGFKYELKTICSCCKGKIKIKDGIVTSKCKCSKDC